VKSPSRGDTKKVKLIELVAKVNKLVVTWLGDLESTPSAHFTQNTSSPAGLCGHCLDWRGVTAGLLPASCLTMVLTKQNDHQKPQTRKPN